MEKIKILFISHTFPPIKGGVESHNYELFTHLSKMTDCKLIANKNRKLIPLFLPFAFVYAIFQIRKYDVLLLGSGLLGIIAWGVKLFSKKPVVIVTHGLDLTYHKSWYQKLWVKTFIPKADKFVAVGNETIRVGIAHGLQKNKFTFIPNGVDTEMHFLPNCTRADLENAIGENIEGKKVILTSGRLAKRKGVAWFISNVLPKLSEEYVYVVAGDGPDRQNITDAVTHTKQHDRVFMLGRVTDEVRNVLFNSCDLFVQPNIKVHGDMEGFGISVIEAGACRLPVLASNMEGLKDAIKEGRNGFLVEPENPKAYLTKINELFANGSPREIYGEKVRNFVIENYQWEKIAQIYLDEIQKIINKKQTSC